MGAPPTLPQAGSCPACPTCVSSSYLASFSLHSTKSNHSKGTALVLLQRYSSNTPEVLVYLLHTWHLSTSTLQVLRKYSRNTLPILLASLSTL